MASREVELVYELSPTQQAMLFHSLYAQGSGVYVVQLSLRLAGRLDVPAFERAWRYLVERHGTLRTGFHWEDLEKPVQVVYRGVDLTVERESWRDFGESEQRSHLQLRLDADREEGFDLAEPPLMRLALFELAPGVHQLIWSHHHLLSDGWSLGLLLRELFTSYAAFAGGREPALERPRSFREHIAWLLRQDLGEAEVFWRRSLAGFSSPTFLAGGEGREADYRDARRQEIRLSADTTSALRETARRHRLTLNTLIQGAWALLLGRSAGAQEVVFGATVSGRPAELPGVESIVGPFINTLPVRVELPPERLLVPWLADLQERQVEQRRYDYAPLYQVQKWSELPAGVALFDNILVFENFPLDSALSGLLPDLTIAELAVNELTNYPVHLGVFPGAELLLELRYDSNRLETPAAVRLLEHLAGLLRIFARDLTGALGTLPLLSPAERHQLTAEWNDTSAPFDTEALIHELISASARRKPEALAVAFEGERLLYGELEERASRLACHLVELGVGPEIRVAIFAERSPAMVVAILAVLKAGGAYVPLDPAYPQERVAYILADSGARVVLTEPGLADALPAGARVVFLDNPAAGTLTPRPPLPPALPPPGRGGEEHAWVGAPLSRAGVSAGGRGDGGEGLPGQNLAYLLYTSGSTGRPKGVAVSHRAVVNYLTSMARRPGLGERDVMMAVTTISFDIAVTELLLPLLVGGRIELVRRETATDASKLAAALEASGATAMQATPATWTLLLDGGWLGRPGLKVLCGGEALPRVLADRLLPRVGELWNVYGPTETTVFSTLEPVGPGGRISIGRPLANTTVHLLGPAGDLVPLGAEGELTIGGAGLARGYHERPELTAERFVPDPFGPPGSRLYHTGDLARAFPDGTLECLGRLDYQMKIRGVRIELGEIEAVLGSHPAVRECVVVARESVLIAYAAGSPADLRSFLAEKLPEAMVPSIFISLEALPRLPNGKVDRRALPAPKRAAGGPLEWDDPVEELLAGIWAEVLGLDRVGRRDDFFELGGHSLLATQVVSRLRGGLGVDLPLRSLFAARTLSAFAEAVREALQGEAFPVPPIVAVPRDEEPALSFSQQRLWFLDQLDPGNPVYNVPTAVRLTGELSAERMERAFAEVVHRHESLRTTFGAILGRPVQTVHTELRLEMPLVDLRDLPEAERESRALALALEEARRPFRLRSGPLLRLVLLRLAGREHLLLVTMHHIVSDGWSIGVLLREIAALYSTGEAAGEAGAGLPGLSVQYADFAHWQRSWLQGEVLEAQLSYWKRQLAGAPWALHLAVDRPRPAMQTYRGSWRAATLSPDLSAALRERCREEGSTPFMVLLAAWAVLLGRHASQEDLIVGTPIAGRNRREIEDLIGFFVNALALRVDLSGAPSFGELLQRVRRTALDAYAHQDLPFDRLVEEIDPGRDLARSPIFQTMLVFQNAPVRALAVPGLTLTPIAVHNGMAKYDLVLVFQEGPSGLTGFLEHNADLFDGTTAERLLARFEALLAGALEDPEQEIWDLPLLLEGERQQVLVEWSGEGKEAAADTLHGRFEAQVRRTPEAVAVTCEGASLTYGELDHRASWLARRLLDRGAAPGSRIGLCLDRSLDLAVGILGILKAGVAYLPLDPRYPRERLAYMIEDAGARILVGTSDTLAGLPAAETVLLDTLEVPAVPAVLSVFSDPSSLAYVIYTSGSTGQPKGTLIPHANVVRLFDATEDRFHFSEGDVWALFHSHAFDFSVWEMWGALLYGGRLVVVPWEVSRSPEAFSGLMKREGVTVLNQTPSAFAQWMRAEAEVLPELRLVIFGGEALDLSALAPWFARHGDRRPALVNMYGITETTVHVTCRPLRAEDAEGERRSFIGAPIPGWSVHVLDPRLSPAPAGVPGELVVGGAGLAWGYLGRPDLTAARFVPDPWSGRPGSRLYRSGDLGRFLPDGDLEYLGRIDHQVKIRGFRIELGEIQAALGSHPAVSECVVTAREDGSGSLLLVAYVVSSPEHPAEAAELRSFLGERLPDYMVPSAFVPLGALPLTPSGKLDRRSLPAPDRSRRERIGAIAAPRTPTEEILLGIWKEVLDLDRVSVEDGFFELGGNSLLAAQALARVHQAFGSGISLRDLFQDPSVAGLAERIDARFVPDAETAEDLEEEDLSLLLDQLDLLSDEEARTRTEDLRTARRGAEGG